MGSCLSCFENNLINEKWAEIINDLVKVESDTFCEYCKYKKNGVYVTDDNNVCKKTCFYCKHENSNKSNKSINKNN